MRKQTTTLTRIFLTLAVIYLFAFVQYCVERPDMLPSERRYHGIVALMALVTAIAILVSFAFLGIPQSESAFRFGPWSFLVLAVPIVQLCALVGSFARMLHHRRSPSR